MASPKKSPKKSPQKSPVVNVHLTEDMLYMFMLHADSKTLSEMCTLNSIASKYCASENFWKLKYEQLPISVKVPSTLKEKLRTYDNTIFYYNSAIDITHLLLSHGTNKVPCKLNIHLPDRGSAKNTLSEVKKIKVVYDFIMSSSDLRGRSKPKDNAKIDSFAFKSNGTDLEIIVSPVVGRGYEWQAVLSVDFQQCVVLMTMFFLVFPDTKDYDFSCIGYDEGYVTKNKARRSSLKKIG